MYNELEHIDRTIDAYKANIELGNALARLKSNKDFKKIIGELYFREEAVRLVHAKSDPALQSPEIQKALLSQMDAIGNLQSFFLNIERLAQQGMKELDSAEELRAELANGEAE